MKAGHKRGPAHEGRGRGLTVQCAFGGVGARQRAGQGPVPDEAPGNDQTPLPRARNDNERPESERNGRGVASKAGRHLRFCPSVASSVPSSVRRSVRPFVGPSGGRFVRRTVGPQVHRRLVGPSVRPSVRSLVRRCRSVGPSPPNGHHAATGRVRAKQSEGGWETRGSEAQHAALSTKPPQPPPRQGNIRNWAARKLLCGGGGAGMGARRRRGGGGGLQKWASVPGLLFCVRTDVPPKAPEHKFWPGKFFSRQNFPPHMCSQNDQRNVGIILSHVCWGRTPPPAPPPSTAGRAAPAQTPLPARRPRRGRGGLGKWASVPSHPCKAIFFPPWSQSS